jgi:hypothetical protein
MLGVFLISLERMIILKKLFRWGIVRLFTRSFSDGCWYRQGTLTPTSIIIDHSHPNSVHLGDTLFFLDTIWAALQANIPVYWVGQSDRMPLASMGVRYASTHADVPPGVILTKHDAWVFLRPGHHTIVGFNFWQIRGPGPIGDLVCRMITRFLYHHVPSMSLVSPVPSWLPVLRQLFQKDAQIWGDIPPNTRLIVVNSFVVSQAIPAYFRQRDFAAYIQRIRRKTSAAIVCVGTQRDAKKPLRYPVAYDLRGQLTILGLLEFLRNAPIDYVVTFDTFMAHAAAIAGCSLRVFSKSKRREPMIQNRFVPFSNCLKSREIEFVN